MDKGTLIDQIAEKSLIRKKEAKVALETTLSSIVEALANGEKVALPGFGTFEVTERAARDGINPRTKEVIQIAASKSVKFKPAKSTKDAVNGK